MNLAIWAGAWLLAVAVGLAISRYFLKKRYDNSLILYQDRLLSREVEEVRNLFTTMRGWRHDYHNHMQSVKGYLASGNIPQALHYIDKLDDSLGAIQLLFNTGNINVDAILNAKISLALAEGIPCDYQAAIPEKLAVADLDLCVILGNLIDNAVESCRPLPEEKRFLRLYIAPLKQQLYISVSNATGETVRKLDREYITHKRGDHGHGLKRIDDAVEKYGGYVNRKNEPGVFVTEIMLPI